MGLAEWRNWRKCATRCGGKKAGGRFAKVCDSKYCARRERKDVNNCKAARILQPRAEMSIVSIIQQ